MVSGRSQSQEIIYYMILFISGTYGIGAPSKIEREYLFIPKKSEILTLIYISTILILYYWLPGASGKGCWKEMGSDGFLFKVMGMS